MTATRSFNAALWPAKASKEQDLHFSTKYIFIFMKPHIAVFNIPVHGHVNPTLAVVAELVRRGYRVTYAATDEFAPNIKAEGAVTISYRSTIPTEPQPGLYTSDDLARAPVMFLEEMIATLPQLEPFYNDNRPDLILYDFMAWAGKVLAAKWEIPAIQLCPTFAANEQFSIDQQFTAIDPYHPALAEFAQRLESFLSSQGMSGVSAEQFFRNIEKFHIVFVPRAFQFKGDTFDDRFLFVGPCLSDRALQVRWEPPVDSRPVLLISLGTAYNAWPEFFKMCVEAFSNLPWHIVMSIGDHINLADLGILPPNFVEVRPRVPQLAILPHCRAFISHGGMNSTMEALYFGVPLVVVPQMQEQEATAHRVAELGLGRMLSRAEISVEALQKALSQVCNDAALLARVQDMQQKVWEAGGAVRAVDAIEAYLQSAL